MTDWQLLSLTQLLEDLKLKSLNWSDSLLRVSLGLSWLPKCFNFPHTENEKMLKTLSLSRSFH